MTEKQWVHCPRCGGKTRLMITQQTVLENLPLFCPKCKQETVIDVRQGRITQIKQST